MSRSSRLIEAWPTAFVILTLSLLSPPSFAETRTWSCPLRFTAETVVPQGWWSAKRNEPDRIKRKQGFGELDGLWLVDGKRGEEIADAPAILAPDDSGWDIANSADSILLVCLYRGRQEILATALPPEINHCNWRPHLDGNELIKDGRITCK